MNIDIAKARLGLDEEFDKKELKKQYRKLMQLVHPDNINAVNNSADNMRYDNADFIGNNGGVDGIYKYSAQEINEAYTYLCEISDKETKRAEKELKRSKNYWNAPINENAYAKRKIFDEVTDHEGNSLGTIVIATDKYIKIPDEEFKFFIKSIFELSKELLDEIDDRLGRNSKDDFIIAQANIAYLLAGQFIDSKKTLFDLNLDVENEEDFDVFYVPAMLEKESKISSLSTTINELITKKSNITLYPYKVANHRLYVCDANNIQLGYLSFSDDRLSFAITPLFEQKSVKVKMEISNHTKGKNNIRQNHIKVDLWLKIHKIQDMTFIDNVNMKIKNILDVYEKNDYTTEYI